jgi:hypothetical protein
LAEPGAEPGTGTRGKSGRLLMFRNAGNCSGSVCRLGQSPTCPFINLSLLYTTSIIPHDCRNPTRTPLSSGISLRPYHLSSPADSPALGSHKHSVSFPQLPCVGQPACRVLGKGLALFAPSYSISFCLFALFWHSPFFVFNTFCLHCKKQAQWG